MVGTVRRAVPAGAFLFWGQRNWGAIRRRMGKRRIADGAARHPYRNNQPKMVGTLRRAVPAGVFPTFGQRN